MPSYFRSWWSALLVFSLQLIMAVDIVAQHFLPKGPIMRPAIPDPQGIANSFVPELSGQLFCTAAKWIILTRYQNYILLF